MLPHEHLTSASLSPDAPVVVDLWPWLALAGLGALHGLSPANGWMFAAACAVHAGGGAQVRHALLPIAIGHVASIALVACATTVGMALDRVWVQHGAGALLVGAAALRMWRGTRWRARISTQAGDVGIAGWSFLMATSQGAGLMLVPALVPLCVADNPARAITASGSLLLAAAAVAVHTAAMLVTTGVVATVAYRGAAMHPRLSSGTVLRPAWTAALAITGVLLMALG